jgi:fungal STAND N-terminal Goodbye domain
MSQTQPTASCSSPNFQSLFDAALKEYEKKTKKDLLAHPLAVQLQNCHSTTAILAVLQDQVQEFDQHRRDGQRLTKWLNPTVNVLYALSATLSEGVGIVTF